MRAGGNVEVICLPVIAAKKEDNTVQDKTPVIKAIQRRRSKSGEGLGLCRT